MKVNSLALALCFLGALVTGLEPDLFRVSFVGVLPAVPSAAFVADIEATIKVLFSDAAHLASQVNYTGTEMTVQFTVGLTTATPRATFDRVWTAVSGLSTSKTSSALWNSFDAISTTRLGASMTLKDGTLAVTMPCQSTSTGICEDGTAVVQKIEVTVQPMSATQLASQFCFAMGLASSSIAACSSVSVVSTTTTGNVMKGVLTIQGIGNAMDAILNAVINAQNPNSFVYAGTDLSDISLVLDSGERLSLYSKSSVTYEQAANAQASANSAGECTMVDYWWVILLVALMPISLVVFRCIYRQGRLAGIEKEKLCIDDEKKREHQLQAHFRKALPPPVPTQHMQPQQQAQFAPTISEAAI